MVAGALLACTGFGPARAEAPSAPWRLDLSATRSNLTGGRADWTETGAALSWRPDTDTWLTAGLERSARFGLKDDVVSLRGARVGAGRASGHLGVALAPDADFRARRQVQAGLLSSPRALDGAWSLAVGLDGSLATYRSGEVKSLQPHLVVTSRRGSSITLRLIETWDEFDRRRNGYAVRTESQLAEHLRLVVIYADAPESDLGATVETEALSGSVIVDIDDVLALRAGVVREARPTFDRTEVLIGLSRRF